MVRLTKEYRPFRAVETTEILNFVAKDIDYKEEKEREKQEDMKEELEYREPFDTIKAKLEKQEREIKRLQEAVERLLDHDHDKNNGAVIISIKKGLDMARY